jgi:hypothetical protein
MDEELSAVKAAAAASASASAQADAESGAAPGPDLLRAMLSAASEQAQEASDAAVALRSEMMAAQAAASVAQAEAVAAAQAEAAATANAERKLLLSQLASREAEVAQAVARQTQAEAGAARWARQLETIARFSGDGGIARVTFRVRCETPFGLSVRLLGNVPELGAWEIPRAVTMRYSGDNTWTCQLSLPTGRLNTYKYLLVNDQGKLQRWQPGADSVLTIYRDETSLEVNDEWSGEPLQCYVAGEDGTREGRQARLLALLEAFQKLVDNAA